MKNILLILLISLFVIVNGQDLPKNRQMELEYTHKLGELVLKKNLKPFQAKVSATIRYKKMIIDYYHFETTKGPFLFCVFDSEISVVSTENASINIYSRFLSCTMEGEEISDYLIVKEAYDNLLKSK